MITFAAGVRSDYGTIHIVSKFTEESPFHPGIELEDDDVIIAAAGDGETDEQLADQLRLMAMRHGATNLNTQVALLHHITDQILGNTIVYSNHA